MGKRYEYTFLQRRHINPQQMKSAQLIIREVQIKTTVSCHLTLVKMAMKFF